MSFFGLFFYFSLKNCSNALRAFSSCSDEYMSNFIFIFIIVQPLDSTGTDAITAVLHSFSINNSQKLVKYFTFPLKRYLERKKNHCRLLPPKELVHKVAMVILMLNTKFGDTLFITLGVIADRKKCNIGGPSVGG